MKQKSLMFTKWVAFSTQILKIEPVQLAKEHFTFPSALIEINYNLKIYLKIAKWKQEKS